MFYQQNLFLLSNLVWKPLHPGLQVIEDVDIVIDHESVIGQEAPPLWLTSLDNFHELLQLPPPEPGGPAEVLLHGDPLGLQQLFLS